MSTYKYINIIKLRRHTKISWRNFEALRLKLVRGLARRKYGSKKAFFKQKKTKKKSMSTRIRYNPKIQKHIWYFGFPHLPRILKTKGSRMGKGKGATNT